MNKNIEQTLAELRKINDRHVGWYMFVVNYALPGKGMRHAFLKENVKNEGVEMMVRLLKQNISALHLVKVQEEHTTFTNYFVFHVNGETTRFKTLAQVICGRSIEPESKNLLDSFLRSGVNSANIQKYTDSDIRYDPRMFSIDHKRAIEHPTKPAFILEE